MGIVRPSVRLDANNRQKREKVGYVGSSICDTADAKTIETNYNPEQQQIDPDLVFNEEDLEAFS